jgi:hypothetical protein
LWTLLAFAGGVAAGPTLTSHALVLIGRAYAMLGISPPQFVEKVTPAAPTPTPAPAAPTIVPLPSPSPGTEDVPTGEERAAAQARAAAPVAPRAAARPEKREAIVAPQPAARAEAAAAPDRAEMPAARPAHSKNAAKALSAKAAPTRATATPQAADPAAGTFQDPFADGANLEDKPRAAAPSRKPKPSFDESTAKSEPAPKPAASPSQDSLDSLMAGAVPEKKGKDKQRESRGLDALLKDVQQGKPEPPPKQEAPSPLPQLSQADIARAMEGVKARGKDCARQLGQKGIAELKLAVGKAGNVTDVSVGGKLANTPVGACIEKAARAASFPRSAGLRFDYRIDVR